MKLKQKIAYIIASMILLVAPMVAFAGTVSAATDIQSGVCAGTSFDVSTSGNCNPATSKASAERSVNHIIETVINIFSVVVGVVAVIMIIVGGLKYITSGGDSAAVSGAKNTILYALVGLVIVVLAQVIVKFVLGRVTS